MLTQSQQQQLEAIDSELYKRHIDVYSYCAQDTTSKLGAVTVTLTHDDDRVACNIYIESIYNDIKKFRVQMSAEYMLEMLRRKRIYGVAIYSDRDELDPEFGAFVSCARLLKHIKQNEKR